MAIEERTPIGKNHAGEERMKISRRAWMGLSVAGVMDAAVRSQKAQAASWETRVLPHPSGEVRPVVTDLAYDRRTDRLASAGDDHLIRLWNVSDRSLIRRLEGHRDWVRAVAFLDERTLASGGNDRTLRAWQVDATYASSTVPQGTILWRGDSPIVRVAVSSSGEYLAAASFSGEVHYWRWPGLTDHRRLLGATTDLRCLAFSPDGSFLAYAGRDGVLRWTDLRSGRVFEQPTRRARRRDLAFLGHRLVAVGDDGRACWCDVRDPSGTYGELKCERGRIFAMAALEEERIAVAGSDNRIRIWNLRSSEKEAELEGHEGTVSAMCWTGNVLVSAGYDTTIRVWQQGVPVARQPRGRPQ